MLMLMRVPITILDKGNKLEMAKTTKYTFGQAFDQSLLSHLRLTLRQLRHPLMRL